jgi:hypothetical protein
MNRRPPPGRREFPREEGPFDRLFRSRFERDPAPLIIGGTIIFLAILILILFLPPLSLLGGGGDGGPGVLTDVGCGITAERADEVPDLPEGLVALSPFYQLTVPAGAEEQGCLLHTISLDTPTQDASNLAFYSYRDGTWVRLAGATLASDGAAAEAELKEIPDNLVVLRLAAAAYLALGSLPSGSGVDPAAEGLLSIVSPADYVPTSDGSIVGTATGLATDEGFDIHPTIAAVEGDAARAVNDILDDSSLTSGHIEAIVSLAESGDFRGIDIDYRQVDALVGSEFSQFITELAQEVHKTGRKLSITLPVPSVRDDGSIDTGAYDWERLGMAADYVKILPESDQLLYRKRMPQVLRYAADIIEPAKVFLVVSPFSHEKSTEGVKALTFLQAMGIANVMTVVPGPEDSLDIVGGRQVVITGDNIERQLGASGIKWNDESATVTFSYPTDDETRTVWVENVFSVGFKLELVQAFRLGGIAIEDVSEGSGGADIWAAVDSLVRGGLAHLEAPNPDNLQPEWTASGGTIEASAAGGSATWIPPEEGGTYEISLIVSDGVTRVGRRLTLEVQATVTPTPTPEETETPSEETETPAPEETETPAPEETETPAPEETETPAPEETETPAPEETETPTPEETETPAPEEETPIATP